MENIIVGQSISEAVPAPATVTGVSVPLEAWQALTQEIEQLWDAYREALDAAERSKNEAHGFLLEIGKRLSEAKERLARPGRNGGWSSFARSAGLTRAEADGLVRRYRRIVKPLAACSTAAEAEVVIAPSSGMAGAIIEPGPEAIDEPPACASEIGTAPQPSGEAADAIAEPVVEAAAATAGAGQASEAPIGVPGSDATPASCEAGAAVADAASLIVA